MARYVLCVLQPGERAVTCVQVVVFQHLSWCVISIALTLGFMSRLAAPNPPNFDHCSDIPAKLQHLQKAELSILLRGDTNAEVSAVV